MRTTSARRGVLAAVAVALLALGGCNALTPSTTATSTSSTAAPTTGGQSTAPRTVADLESAYEQVIQRVLPSIVQINTSSGLGSGIVYDTAGHILTNAHVVGQSQRFQVTLASGGEARNASLVASFPPNDLAVIKVDDARGLTPAKFGDSSKLRVGQIVLAMGNPLGLSGSVTNGIISAVGRTVTEPQGEGSPGATITNAIQTSAAINPGNSGGALVDLSGQVIGIPTLAATDPELGGGAAPGIGFAIPSATATNVANQIIKNGRVGNRAALGVQVMTVVDENGQPAGVGVAGVTRGGGAQKAGIQPGDVILKVNGTPTPSTSALEAVLATLEPGDQAKVEIRRNGATQTVTVTLGTLPGG